jgi:hypothetical protein
MPFLWFIVVFTVFHVEFWVIFDCERRHRCNNFSFDCGQKGPQSTANSREGFSHVLECKACNFVVYCCVSCRVLGDFGCVNHKSPHSKILLDCRQEWPNLQQTQLSCFLCAQVQAMCFCVLLLSLMPLSIRFVWFWF